ncbi:hypothetical protein SARC_17628, partial [Sphaeroforma arctica JP610]
LRAMKAKFETVEMEKEQSDRKIVDLQKQIEHLEDRAQDERTKFENLKKEHDNIIAELL